MKYTKPYNINIYDYRDYFEVRCNCGWNSDELDYDEGAAERVAFDHAYDTHGVMVQKHT